MGRLTWLTRGEIIVAWASSVTGEMVRITGFWLYYIIFMDGKMPFFKVINSPQLNLSIYCNLKQNSDNSAVCKTVCV